MKQLVIIGASGHGKVVADIARRNEYDKILFLDDDESLEYCDSYPIVGKCTEFINFDCDFIVAIGNAETRQRIHGWLEANGKAVVPLIHPSAVIGENVNIGIGTVVMAGAVINPGTQIGKGCIINTCSSVDHDCVLGDFVHVAVGAHMAGSCTIGERTWIGAGSTVSNNINICADCMIGAGAVVIRDIEKPGTYIGIPAKEKIMSKHMLTGGGTAPPK